VFAGGGALLKIRRRVVVVVVVRGVGAFCKYVVHLMFRCGTGLAP
jgi:hypothetical protein